MKKFVEKLKSFDFSIFVYEVLKRANKVVIDNTLLYNYIKHKDWL